MSREKELIKRIENDLRQEGLVDTPIYGKLQEDREYPIGNYLSYFQMMVDLRLEGNSLSSEEIWTRMKKQINSLRGIIGKAEEAYTRLANEHRGLKSDYNELLRETHGRN